MALARCGDQTGLGIITSPGVQPCRSGIRAACQALALAEAQPLRPSDPFDAIYTAVRMLFANGARDGSTAGIEQAIFAYNHARWYASRPATAQETSRDQRTRRSSATAPPLPADAACAVSQAA